MIVSSLRKEKFLVLTDGSLRLLQGSLVHDVSEHGQQECYGFSAAGLSDTNEVSARHDGRDGLGLDGRGFLIAVPLRENRGHLVRKSQSHIQSKFMIINKYIFMHFILREITLFTALIFIHAYAVYTHTLTSSWR